MLYIFQKEDHLSSYRMELNHLNLVDETNVQMALCPKNTSFYIIITSDVQWVQKKLIVQKNSNQLLYPIKRCKISSDTNHLYGSMKGIYYGNIIDRLLF